MLVLVAAFVVLLIIADAFQLRIVILVLLLIVLHLVVLGVHLADLQFFQLLFSLQLQAFQLRRLYLILQLDLQLLLLQPLCHHRLAVLPEGYLVENGWRRCECLYMVARDLHLRVV